MLEFLRQKSSIFLVVRILSHTCELRVDLPTLIHTQIGRYCRHDQIVQTDAGASATLFLFHDAFRLIVDGARETDSGCTGCSSDSRESQCHTSSFVRKGEIIRIEKPLHSEHIIDYNIYVIVVTVYQ